MFARIRLGLTIISVLAAVVQLIFFLDGPNLFCVAVTLGVSLIGFRIMGKPEYVQEFPLSTISALLFIFSSLTLPLVFSSIEFRPITRNLFLPVDVLAYLGLLVVVVLIAHWIYRKAVLPRKVRALITWKVSEKLGLFNSLTPAQLWMMGIIGTLCLLYKAYAFSAKGSVGEASILQKVVTGMIPFAYAPFLIPFNRLFATKPWKVTAKIAIPLLFYFGPIVAAAVLRNDRSDFAMAPVTMLLALIIGVLTQRIRLHRFNFKLMIPVFVTVVFVYPMLADLAIAMVIVRKEYGKQGAREQVQLTLDMYAKRDEIDKYLEQLNQSPAKYDESYYNANNVFLERFANLKFHDNSLVLGGNLDEGQLAQLRDFSIGNALSGFPDPVLRLMGFDIDKSQYNTMSVGDYFYFLNTGGGLGGFRVGSVIGHGLALFGYFFFPLFGVVVICYFVLIDSLTYRKKITVESVRTEDWRLRLRPVYSLPYIAPLVLLDAFDMLNPYRWGSVAEIPLFILRDMPQNIVLYIIVYYGSAWAGTLYVLLRRGSRREGRIYSGRELPAQ
jgi:hypothetical protein